MTSLVNNLGGTAGFGENFLSRNDDGSTSRIDLTAVFGSQGINFFGNYYTGLYVNNNGSVSFTGPIGAFTPSAITGATSNPIIAAYWADVDTTGGAVSPTPGGTSAGTNLLWYDLDTTTHTFTATWDDVGYYSAHTNKLNAFQISIREINTQGDFDITLRYENIDWTTGDFSGGSNGLGGTVARAGYSSGNGTEYFELPQSGNQAAMLDLENASNIGTPGTFVFQVRNGVPTAAISIGDASIAEGNGPEARYISIPVTLTAPSSSVVTVHYATSNGTALAGSDYAAQSGIVTFAAGVTQQTIQIAITGDTVVEGNETFTITLSDPSENASILDDSATATITNDDASLSIAATSADKAEGQSGSTPFTFTVTRTGDTTSAVSAQWAVSGAAVNGADFAGGVLPSGTVSFAAGETSQVITVNVAGDIASEANEAFSVTLSGPSAGAILGTASASGTIRNDDSNVSLSIAATSANKAEGQSGTTPFTFTVTRTGDTTLAVSAQWTVGGVKVNGADFVGGVLPSGTVNFAAGETSKVITVNVAGDTVVEANEAFSVTLSNPSTGSLGTASANGQIRNDDASLSIAATSANKAEGQSGSTPFTFTVTRAGDTTSAVSAQWAVSGVKVNGADFVGGVLPTGTVSFAAGETSKVITIDVSGDTLVEAKEAFTVTLSNPSGAVLGTASANGAICNDDACLSIAATSANKAEGQAGATPFTFTVTRAGDTTSAVTAQWAVSGAAVNGADFVGGVLPTGTVSFAAGETSKLITIDVAGDTVIEAKEAFTVTLSNPSVGAILGTATASGAICNDDACLSIAATSADKAEGQSGITPFTFTVTRTGDTTSAVSAHWAVIGGMTNGADFAGGVLPSGMVSFAAGETSKVITVNVAGDTLPEWGELFSVALSAPSVGAVLGTASAYGLIRGDDASMAIVAVDADKAEGQAGLRPFTFSVTRTGDPAGAASVHWSLSGAAVRDSDFLPLGDLPTPLPLDTLALVNFMSELVSSIDDPNTSLWGGEMPFGTVTFSAGESQKMVTVWVMGDTLSEADESFTVTLSDATAGYTIGTPSAVGTIRNDDGANTVRSSVDTTLGAGDLNLTLLGTANINGTGNALDNQLFGNPGNNLLMGGLGNDTLAGRGGRDVLDGGGGIDTADYSEKIGPVSATLAGASNATVRVFGLAEDTIRNIENLKGGWGNDTLVGDGLDNTLDGGAGNDVLSGGDGRDTLIGGEGRDRLTGGTGADIFRFDADDTLAAFDVITDFATGIDKIDLDIFSGTPSASAYSEVAVASDDFSVLLRVAITQMAFASTPAVFVAGNSDGWLFWKTASDAPSAYHAAELQGRNSLPSFDRSDLT